MRGRTMQVPYPRHHMSTKHAAPRRWPAVIGAALAVVVLIVVVIVGARRLRGTADPIARSVSPATLTSTPSPTASTTQPLMSTPTTRPTRTPPRKPAVTPRRVVDATMSKLSSQLPAGGVSVAAVDMKTGAKYTYGATEGMRTGSVYKLLVLETLLLQRQDQGSQLTDFDVAQATPMIENSDNKAAYRLFLEIGANPGLAGGAKRLGLGHTLPGQADPALTTMSAQDGIAMLANLVGKGPLSQYSRSFALGLMRNIETDQRWGVSVVADRGSTFAVKNGWLQVDNSNGPAESDDSRWLVNSVGVVSVRHQQLLLAVFTQHGQSLEDGIELVETMVKTITPAVVAH